MNKTQTKIILVLGIVLIIGLFFWGWSIYQEKKVSKVSEKVENPALSCALLPEQLIAFCKLDAFNTPQPLSEYESVSLSEENDSKIEVPVVHPGDKIIGRINIAQFLKEHPKIQQKLPSSVLICLNTRSLAGEQIFSPSVLQRYNRYDYGFYACTNPLNYKEIQTIDFGGIVPFLEESEEKYDVFHFFVYLIDAQKKNLIAENYVNMLKILHQQSPVITTLLKIQNTKYKIQNK